MHLRKLTLTVGLLGGALCTNLAYSLGLGEITLKSALDEPLNAEIKLLQVRDLTSGEIIIGLASIEDFKRAGVDRVFFLQDLKFEVLLNNPGGPIVKVTSRKPVQEPYVNFLVQTRWPSGRLLREYTLLLDLPVFADKPVQAVQPAQARPQPAPLPAPVRPSQAQTSPAPAVEPQQPVRPAPAVVTTQPVAPSSNEPSYADDEYAVQANDTLWEIALRVRPNRSVSIQQTMVALQRINPNAFINDNINLLKKGQILKIPDQNEIENIEQQEAIGTVAYQNDQWAGGNATDSASGAQLEGSSASSSDDTVSDEPRGQLTLAAPSDVESAAQSSGSGDTSDTAELESDLTVNLEELDSARRESDELNTRVGELDEQIETIERLIDVSSEEMRALQLAAENTAEDASEVAIELSDDIGEVVESEEAADTAPEVGNDTLVDADQAIVESEAVEPEITEEPVVEAPVVVPPAPRKSFMDIAMENLWYIIAAVLAVIAGIGVFMHRKAQAEMAAFDELDDELYEGANFDQDEFGSDEEALDAADDDYDLDSVDSDESDSFDEEEPAAPTESETGDAVGEADIYIAYGKYDQAEEMLQRAIVADSNNIPARLKLLEVYAETKNIEKFDAEYAQVIGFNDSSANREAEELRGRIPDAGEFSLASAEAANLGDDLSDELDFGDDLSAELDGAADTLDSLQNDLSSDFDDTLEESSESSPDFGEISLDFDSDDSSSESTLTDSMGESLDFDIEESSSTSSGDAANEFELNLDLDDLEDEVEAKDLIAESEEQEDGFGDIDFSIDLDGEPQEDLSEEAVDEEDLDSGLTLDLDDSADDPESESISDDDDFLSDLEFTAGSQPSESIAPTSESSSSLDDAFDLDMDNVDLAALDEEMDALVGDLDDLDDEPSASATESVSESTEDDLGGAEVEIPENLDLSDDTTDLDDMISLDEPSLDELTFGGEESDLGESLSNDISKASADALSFEEDAGVDDDELGSELDFLADTDEVATKLDLARAYIDMGDKEGAKDILDEVVSEGNDEQKLEAQELIGRI